MPYTARTMFTEIQCVVSGKVQGVGFRDFVQRTAGEHNLVGFVENKEDGTVVVVAQGIPDDLKEFVSQLNGGSSLSRVDGVGVEWRSPENFFDDFVVRY